MFSSPGVGYHAGQKATQNIKESIALIGSSIKQTNHHIRLHFSADMKVVICIIVVSLILAPNLLMQIASFILNYLKPMILAIPVLLILTNSKILRILFLLNLKSSKITQKIKSSNKIKLILVTIIAFVAYSMIYLKDNQPNCYKIQDYRYSNEVNKLQSLISELNLSPKTVSMLYQANVNNIQKFYLLEQKDLKQLNFILGDRKIILAQINRCKSS